MRRTLPLAILGLISISACSSGEIEKQVSQPPANTGQLDSDSQKFGYAVGYDLGRSLAPLKQAVDVQALEKAFEEGLAGQPPRLTDQERRKIKVSVFAGFQNDRLKARTELVDKNLAEARQFLAENARKPGIKTASDGLQYEALAEGAGNPSTADDRVVVNYTESLADGTVIDSTAQRQQAATLAVGTSLPGLREGLLLMTPGSHYRLFIPAELAYGLGGDGQKVGPNAMLIYDITLVSVIPGKHPATAGKSG